MPPPISPEAGLLDPTECLPFEEGALSKSKVFYACNFTLESRPVSSKPSSAVG